MKNISIISITLLLIIAMMSCETATDTFKKSPISGYSYEVYQAGSGDKAEVGKYVYFQFDIYDDRDSLLQSYRNQKQMPSIKIPPIDDEARKGNPVVDVLSNLVVGDSIGIVMPKDSMSNLPLGYEYVENFIYAIAVKEVVDEATFKARIAQMQEEEQAKAAALQEQFPSIVELANETLDAYKAGTLETVEVEGGLKYYIHEQGTGAMPVDGAMAAMLYYGALVSNKVSFDNSYERGRSYPFRVGQGSVIKGWDVGVKYLPVGTKASLFIPSSMGYGENGFPPDIPADSELYFYVEVEELFY